MENKSEEIERYDSVDTFGKLMEEGFQVAMLSNGFADIEEGLKLTARLFEGRSGPGGGRLMSYVSHRVENNTAFQRRSTVGKGWPNRGSSVYSQENKLDDDPNG
jgi:hypothetical protein